MKKEDLWKCIQPQPPILPDFCCRGCKKCCLGYIFYDIQVFFAGYSWNYYMEKAWWYFLLVYLWVLYWPEFTKPYLMGGPHSFSCYQSHIMKLIVGKFWFCRFYLWIKLYMSNWCGLSWFSVQAAEPAKTRFSMYYFYELIWIGNVIVWTFLPLLASLKSTPVYFKLIQICAEWVCGWWR